MVRPSMASACSRLDIAPPPEAWLGLGLGVGVGVGVGLGLGLGLCLP